MIYGNIKEVEIKYLFIVLLLWYYLDDVRRKDFKSESWVCSCDRWLEEKYSIRKIRSKERYIFIVSLND